MEKTKGKSIRSGIETQLTTLMRAVVEARFRLERARERLHSIEQKLRLGESDASQRQREKALGEYIEAVSKARAARTELLRELRDHTA